MAKLIDFEMVECDAILFEGTSFQSYGYGIISQLPMKDRNLSIQSKGVYGYLVACAGNDKQTYPSQEKMCYDLNIGKPATLRKYIKELQENGYVKIVKTKKNNIHYKNVYLIATDTRSQEVWKDEFANGKEIEEAEIIDEKEMTYGKSKNKEASPTPIEEAESNNKLNTCTDIICENKEKYTSELMENVEDKNKRLMEQERKFVPKYKL